MSLTASKVKALLSRAVDYFDVTTLSKIDLITKGDKTIYVDPLGNRTQPIPSDVGHNVYYVHGPKDEFRQEIHFQNGSPAQGVNGLSNEAVISVVLHRLSKQNESFPSPYNVLAIYLLQGALAALHSRVKDRQDFGIYDTDKVEPTDKDDAKTSRSLAIINSLGILGNVIFKYDSAYALNTPKEIHGLLDNLLSKVNLDDVDDLNITSAFSFLSSVICGTGVFRAFASIGSEFIRAQNIIAGQQALADQNAERSQNTEDNSTNNTV